MMSPDLETFRLAAREWLAENFPAALRGQEPLIAAEGAKA
ncbi:MAG: hypothetical protein JWQ97_266, partial [Phenylobacterium sp.]|nr:hypothetical protein [Phenylobacterium sp.]